jgi:hypothetical protein
MLTDYFESQQDKPSVISVGSGNGYHEQQLREQVGLDVTCYDKEGEGCLPVCQFANFPEDNARVIPADCRHVILFSAYPEGYLGELVKLYKQKGGTKLCVVVEDSIYSMAHLSYEPDYGLHCGGDLNSTCLLTAELATLKEIGATSLPLGGAISRQQRAVTNIEFYGDWNHQRLRELSVAGQSEDSVASASGYHYRM